MKYNQPLGLPEGSVNAIITLMFLATALGLTVYTYVSNQEANIPEWLSGMVALTVGFYFGKRQADNQAQPERVEPVASPEPAELEGYIQTKD